MYGSFSTCTKAGAFVAAMDAAREADARERRRATHGPVDGDKEASRDRSLVARFAIRLLRTCARKNWAPDPNRF